MADHAAESLALSLLRGLSALDEERLIVPQRQSRTSASMAGNHDECIVGFAPLP